MGPLAPRVLLHAFSTLRLGGPQVRFAQCVERFGDRFRHIVVAMDGTNDALSSIRDRSLVELLELPVRKGRLLRNVPMLTRALRKLRPAGLVTYNWGAIEWAFAAWLQRLPHVHVEDGFGPDEVDQRLFRRSMTRCVGLRLSHARLVMVSSMMRAIALREWRVPEGRCILIPNGVHVDGYGNRSERITPSRFARVGDEIVIGTVAKLRAEKRVDRLVEAVAIVGKTCKVCLVIVGDGPESRAIERLAAELGIDSDCIFLGMRSDLHEILPELDIFALSSDTEQMPIAMLEAMAAGLPVAATDVGDVRAILPANSGNLIVGRDAAELAGAIERLATDEDLRMRIGLENRTRVAEHYRDTTMFEQWERVYGGEWPIKPAPDGAELILPERSSR